ncbi:protein kinase C-binding protein 1-like isoform X3 [Denticeps clupeoides]|uniref:protein kinase C-binding protein 1-like isoform X3 n=1 Tax=Denticeps clupeoides TaxID=299321 RepID=UPI0010A574C3|nr:protein kinase C-binding protein 1-like isoform X3 [Denticeps clupeoides]
MIGICLCLAEEEIKTESDVVEGMEVSVRSKVSEPGSAEKALVAQKRKVPSPPHSSNGHSPSGTSPSPIKKKKKPGLVNSNNKDQSELRHGPFYYAKQPALTTDPVDVVPQDSRNDFYCWVCHREGQVLCCELCPRVYHAKCLKLPAEPEGDWFCPECEKITVAECIETQSKAMMMLTLDQLSYLLKFGLQKMKQPGTEPFQKPVSLEQHPDYAEYIFHPMDLCTLEKNIKKKMYGCTEAFLADVKWILHNCIIYNGGNHKLTATAKVIVKICEHEMNEIEVCPECYLSACQKRENWFCEPCSHPHPLVWAKLKGFPFWPAKALRDKDGQVDARFFGQHDRAWVPINNCYLMSKEIPFSVKKTKSIFNSAMQEMEVYVENIRKRFGVFNYAPFRTPYTPNNQFQMLVDPANPSAGTVRPEKPEKIKFNFDMTASPKMLLGKSLLSGGAARRISMTDMPRSPMSTNSSVHTGSDVEQDVSDRGSRAQHYSAGEESLDCTASPVLAKTGPAGSSTGSPKPFSPQGSTTPFMPKQERGSTGSILNLNLDRIKAEMDLKELSETVQQQQQQLQGAPVLLTSCKRPIRSLDKTIESCKAQLGIHEISEDVYRKVEHSDSEDTDKSDSSDSEYFSDEDQKPKTIRQDSKDRDSKKRNRPEPLEGQGTDFAPSNGTGTPMAEKPVTDATVKDKPTETQDKTSVPQPTVKEEARTSQTATDNDSDSEKELVIDLGQDLRERKRLKKEASSGSAISKEAAAVKGEGKPQVSSSVATSVAGDGTPSNTSVKDSGPNSISLPVSMVTFTSSSSTSLHPPNAPSPAAPPAPAASSTATAAVKKQRPLLPKDSGQSVQRTVVWSPSGKLQAPSQKWQIQKVQSEQQQAPPTLNSAPSSAPPTQPAAQMTAPTSPPSQSPSSSTRYQTRQAVKGASVQQKDVPQGGPSGEFNIPTASADVAADIAKYTSKMMDAIKGTMTEIYNDLSKSTSGNTIAEIRRLRIEIEKLQWLHQQELSEMKHNLELTMAEMRQSLEQERERMVAEVRKQMEQEKQQAVDETKKKQWCANCRKEAIFYCCWNTSYCDYPCQQAHWPEHMKSCTQSATATQQETEAEASSETTSKQSGPPPQASQSPVKDTTATAIPPLNKDSSPNTERGKDCGSISVS